MMMVAVVVGSLVETGVDPVKDAKCFAWDMVGQSLMSSMLSKG
jgi:hypothetical protein